MDIDKKLLHRVQKLLDKADATDQEGEAQLFYAKAQQLMREHGITMMQLRDESEKAKDSDFGKDRAFSRAKIEQWESIIAEAIAIATGTHVIYYRPRRTGTGDQSIVYVGFKADVAVAVAMFPRVRKTMMRFAKEYVQSSNDDYDKMQADIAVGNISDFIAGFNVMSGKSRARRIKLYGKEWRSFCIGFGMRLYETAQYEKQMAAAKESESSTALIIRKDSEVDDYVNREFGDLEERKSNVSSIDRHALHRGQIAADRSNALSGNKLEGGE